MESDRFDALTRSVASRRTLVAKAGGGGLGALVLGTLGLREEAAAATTCLLDVRLFVRVGPSAGFPLLPKQTKSGQLTGQLHLTISSKGDLGGSTFVLPDGSSFPVVGSVSSHLIGARITLAKGQVLVLQGVDEGGVTSCHGAIDGSLVGPREGDLGDWHATVVPAGAPTTTPTATATTASGTQGVVQTPISAPPTNTSAADTPTDTQPTPTDTNVPDAPTDTPTARPTRSLCSECQTAQAGSGCQPVADDTPCSGGLCCQGICVALSELSHNPNHCGSCGNVCANGCCHASACCACDPGQTDCGGTCVDLNTDASNCGACGNACGSGQICFGGLCATDHRGNGTGGCPQGQINCGGTCTTLKVCP